MFYVDEDHDDGNVGDDDSGDPFVHFMTSFSMTSSLHWLPEIPLSLCVYAQGLTHTHTL